MKRKKSMVLAIFILLSTFFCLSCHRSLEVVTDSQYMLDTYLQISIWTDNKDKGQKLIKKCFDRIKEIEEKMSVHVEDSEVSRINRNAGNKFITVSRDTEYVLNKASYYAALTDGAFDPTIGYLVKLWGIGTPNEKIPLSSEIDEALKYIDYKRLSKSKKNNHQFRLDKSGMYLDLGGIAKGYAADEVRKILIDHGVKHAVINLGGNVLALGQKVDGSEWRIGIQDPFQATGTYMGVIDIADKAVVTSGNYERYFTKNNHRYHHILNPNTGYPSENGIVSCTIVADSSTDADALSTGVYVLGIQKGLDLVGKLKDVECILVTKDRKVYLSSGIKEKVEIVDDTFKRVE